ncbi:hypothetical protein [Leptolyngbya sp. FACHB-261]|uniref:hypothetical protein n=1 Tax=Leptolyngbya sp. FACHB-261 TaxID=2692806 RepID=UPI001686F05F|nr:hypothetical protein [Leptolyngbya sp. FACHB-261]MBD2103001.1 hypothetical protein [Leptolyngbya sp. FACHB-261]
MINIHYIVSKALSTQQLSDWAEWRINDLLSHQKYTPVDLHSLDRLIKALEQGDVVRRQTASQPLL